MISPPRKRFKSKKILSALSANDDFYTGAGVKYTGANFTLISLLKKDKKFEWNPEHQKQFDDLKSKL